MRSAQTSRRASSWLPQTFFAGFFLAALAASSLALAAGTEAWETGPQSSYVTDDHGLTLPFCQKWNPEFEHQGFVCCADPFQKTKGRRRPALRRCDPKRFKATFCGEMTDEQINYSDRAARGELGDLLEFLKGEIGRKQRQSFCGVNNGFLVNGRRVIATPQNQIKLSKPQRCTNFGTDEMAAMLEWLGREVAATYPLAKYPSAKLLIGDISPPRGGCMTGRGGRRGHSSHTAGRDVDLAFLVAKERGIAADFFHKEFDVEVNWWLLKKIFANPFVCVQKVFLDRKLISKLARAYGSDPLWKEYRNFVQHVKFHRNHFHVRIGEAPGPAGCRMVDEEEIDLNDALEELSDAAAAESAAPADGEAQ